MIRNVRLHCVFGKLSRGTDGLYQRGREADTRDKAKLLLGCSVWPYGLKAQPTSAWNSDHLLPQVSGVCFPSQCMSDVSMMREGGGGVYRFSPKLLEVSRGFIHCAAV